MIETEIKIKVPDFLETRRLLKKMKATFQGESHEINHLFEDKDGKIRENKIVFRIREFLGRLNGEFAIKIPVRKSTKNKNFKEMHELNFDISWPHTLISALKENSFREWFYYLKHRNSWKLGEIVVSFDFPIHEGIKLGHIVEIEGKAKEIKKVIKLLKLENHPRYTESYQELFERIKNGEKI